MKLTELVHGLLTVEDEREITGLALDSRLVEPGNLFIALSGSSQHGLSHARQALAHGASVRLYDPA
ncbi:MAG: Mur ligase domain-containing protein, partial [Gammaproteobacteria bacterium]